MGQYWIPVNLDKREFVQPHKLGDGLKLWELLANGWCGKALVILTAAMPEPRGGGDFDLTENWHGPERTFPEHNMSPGPMPDSYAEVAKRTIGRWAGDRIAFVGDYAEDGDLTPKDGDPPASLIYALCPYSADSDTPDGFEPFTDVSDDVCRVIEHELNGRFEGDGWRSFKYDREAA